MVPITEKEIAELFTTAIVGITPRVQYKGAERWKPHKREKSGTAPTRHFRLVFGLPRLRQGSGSVMSGHAFAHDVEMRVRTAYAGSHADLQFAIADDFMQLRDVLSGLKAHDNGLMLVSPVEVYVAGTNSPIQTSLITESADAKQIDHTYTVRYLRSIAP